MKNFLKSHFPVLFNAFKRIKNFLVLGMRKTWITKIGALFFGKYEFKENYICPMTLEELESELIFKILLESLDKTGIKKGAKILDCGCNKGNYSILLARQGYNVFGVDINKNAIDSAKSAIEQERSEVRERIKLETQNIVELNLPEKQFDFVLMISLLEHLYADDIDKLLERTKAHLKPNAYVLISVPFREKDDTLVHVSYHSPEKLKKILLRHNFFIDKMLIFREDWESINILAKNLK